MSLHTIEDAKILVKGDIEGLALVSNIGLSFWGGVNPHTGFIVDQSHDLCGKCISGKVLCVPSGRGSCSSSGTMLEMIRAKTAPLAIICVEAEPILSLGSVIGSELYGSSVAIYSVDPKQYGTIKTEARISILDDVIRIITEE